MRSANRLYVSQAFSAAGAAAGKDITASDGFHALAETYATDAFDFRWLPCSFHEEYYIL